MSKSRRPPLDRALYDEVVEEAKARFRVWPSAYASGWVVAEYKRRGGRYGGERDRSTGIARWFDESWVDLSRPIHDRRGNLVGYEPCGRKHSDQRAYPKCRPLAAALRMTPQQVADAVSRKQAVEQRVPPRRGRRPINVPTFARTNPGREGEGEGQRTGHALFKVRCACGWSWDVEDGDPDPLMCHKCWTEWSL